MGRLTMATGYSQTPNLLKGAIIQFSAPMLIPIPNIVIFQYNPETLSRGLTPWSPIAREFDEEGKVVALKDRQIRQLAQPYDPDENISLTLELDAADAMEEPGTHPVGARVGVADRLAALEMLMYPPGKGALGSLLASVSVSIGPGGISAGFSAKADIVETKAVPVVLFFWGPGRIVPVRISSFSIEEQAFNPLLYPIRAKVTLGMKVLDEEHLVNIENEKGSDTAAVTIAKACYKFTRVQKELLATANLANSVESIIGMLPL
jgi:hypothetical protein